MKKFVKMLLTNMSAMDHIVIVVRNKGLASNSNRATTRVDQTGKGKRTKLH